LQSPPNERRGRPVTGGPRLGVESVTTYPRRVHDVVIVGGGTAGCVLASRLTEDPARSVLLLEAGARSRKLEIKIPAAFSRLYRTNVDWGDSTTPQPRLDDREVVFPRGRMLGGSAAMNAMMILRGHRSDYDAWAAAGSTGWGWEDVEPAFARSAQGAFPLGSLPEQHVLAEAFVHAAQAVGIPFTDDLNGESNEGVGFVPVSQRRGRRFSVLDGYLRPARRRPNLTIATDALDLGMERALVRPVLVLSVRSVLLPRLLRRQQLLRRLFRFDEQLREGICAAKVGRRRGPHQGE